jgi:outer membrane receptor protein involved in Fe transport
MSLNFRFFLLLISCFTSLFASAQTSNITISGTIIDKTTLEKLPFVSVVINKAVDSTFQSGTISDINGRFIFENVLPGNYTLTTSYIGYSSKSQSLFVGNKSDFIAIGEILLEPSVTNLEEVVIQGKRDEISSKMDKKEFYLEDNITQSGGSAIQAMESLPGITIVDSKVNLRGSNQIIILIDGKQSALTGYGGQSGLENIPSSSIERIEIINNPTSKYDANGNAGIINIILKKENKEGLNGTYSAMAGVGSFWIRKENLPSVRDQYQFTPKINPSLSLNYRKKKINAFVLIDNLYTKSLYKNEFVTRTYDDGTIINQQTKRNRTTNFFTSTLGLDWYLNESNQITVSAMIGIEHILDTGDQPFFNANNERLRLWQFVEDEIKTTIMGKVVYSHQFELPGRTLNSSFNYTFHRENEQYTFQNTLPNYTGEEAFKLLSDEKVGDLSIDYTEPLKYGKLETGLKLRVRTIPTNMQFFPSTNSPLDSNAGGKATYSEIIPAIYGNYLVERNKWDAELGVRLEYVQLNYNVDPNHNTYKSDGYDYFQPFPSLRLGYKVNSNNKLSIFYNRRIDRPNEVDIRIFPKYDDAEIIKVGNPSLRPQYTNSIELGSKKSMKNGYWYNSLYSRFSEGTITRISSTVAGSNLIYAVFQNAGKSNNTGIESVFAHDLSKAISYNLGINFYYNTIEAFTVNNIYPQPSTYSSSKQTIYSGNAKLNTTFHLKNNLDINMSAIYLAPDIIPQGKVGERFTLNLGLKKSLNDGKVELFINASDLLNTSIIRKNIQGDEFRYNSIDYRESQVIRVGYKQKF